MKEVWGFRMLFRKRLFMGDEKLLENDVVSGSAENLDTVLMDYMDDDMTDENADPFNPVIDENDPNT